MKPHLSLEEVEARYCKATDAVEGRQWQIICLLASIRTIATIKVVLRRQEIAIIEIYDNISSTIKEIRNIISQR